VSDAAATQGAPRNGRERAFRLCFATGALLCAVLLALSLPRAYAAWRGFDDWRASEAWRTGRTPSPAGIAAAIRGLEGALAVVPSARREQRLATLLIAQADALPPGASERATLLAAAETRLSAGLAVAPYDGFGWLRLADVRSQLGRAPGEVVAAAILSLEMAPNERHFWLWRLGLLLPRFSVLSSDDGELVARQIRTVWSQEWHRPRLLKVAQDRGSVFVLRIALAPDVEATAELDRLAGPPPEIRLPPGGSVTPGGRAKPGVRVRER